MLEARSPIGRGAEGAPTRPSEPFRTAIAALEERSGPTDEAVGDGLGCRPISATRFRCAAAGSRGARREGRGDLSAGGSSARGRRTAPRDRIHPDTFGRTAGGMLGLHSSGEAKDLRRGRARPPGGRGTYSWARSQICPFIGFLWYCFCPGPRARAA